MKMVLALCELFTLFYKGSACKSSANLANWTNRSVENPGWFIAILE